MAFIDNPKVFDCKKCFIFRGKDIIVQNGMDSKNDLLPTKQIINRCLSLNCGLDWFIDSVTDCGVIGLSEDEPEPSGCKAIPLREYFSLVSEEEGALAARQKAYLNWRVSTRFCSCCGGKLENNPQENSRVCSKCNTIVFPRIEPCVIVLVSKGEKILLARHKQRNQDIYACIAGFIESGETVEQAVHREVLEETGIQVKNVVYKGSQGWPFPDQLMLAFTAEYESGEIKVQEEELSEAKWFDKSEISSVTSPKPGSVAYKLINNLF